MEQHLVGIDGPDFEFDDAVDHVWFKRQTVVNWVAHFSLLLIHILVHVVSQTGRCVVMDGVKYV